MKVTTNFQMSVQVTASNQISIAGIQNFKPRQNWSRINKVSS